MCTAAEFAGQVDLWTTLSLVTSPEPPQQGATTLQAFSEASGDQTILTSSAEVNSSELAQGDEVLENEPEPRQLGNGELEALEAAHGSPFDFVCGSPCMFDGENHSCKERVQWLIKEG